VFSRETDKLLFGVFTKQRVTKSIKNNGYPIKIFVVGGV